jgi:hypothetical protein
MSNNITYEWQFPALDVNYSVGEMKKVVTTVHWVLVATAEDGYSASVYGSIGVPEPTPEAFVSYEDLTQEEVQAWVESAMRSETEVEDSEGVVTTVVTDSVQELYESLARQIEVARAPLTGTLIPSWVAGA